MTREYLATHNDLGPMHVAVNDLGTFCVRTPIGPDGEPQNDRDLELCILENGRTSRIAFDAEEVLHLVEALEAYINGKWPVK